MISDRFDHSEAEPRIYAEWEKAGAFKPSAEGEPYAIVIPPPNVTGVLHMGHALNNTLQDILVRYHRMLGRRVLWQPGTDHAGIATQMVVERELAKEGNQGRRDLGRDKFLERVWKWKDKSGGQITQQLKRLGASCDWSRERFTLDEGLNKAVTKVFVDLHREGLIYRAKRLVNWDPQFQTAISDLEVETKEVKGHFWRFRYPLADGSTYKFPIAFDEAGKATEWEDRNYIVVATTRPETMLGDTAVAVHPDDERYKALIGKSVKLPLVGRIIPIVADDYADPAQGSGAVKITPAHDFNDYQVGKRHKLPMINIFTDEAFIRETFDSHTSDGLPDPAFATPIPAAYAKLERFAARRKVVADIEAEGLLDGVEDKTIMQPFGDRSQVVVEPYLTDQWYVDAATLAKPAIKAVEDGDTKFVPENWAKTYFEWMRNIEPWCVSRQLWWGHRIPVWYAPDNKPFVAHDEAEASAEAKKHYGKAVELRQDEDVLDTWFSSALWPFSTQGWPEKDPTAEGFYPGSVLVTAFDIIFFWVARMMMQGIHFMGEVPFKDVYIHALVRDEKGQKMSKSKGNVMDPLDIIDGCDLETLVKKRTTGLMNPNDAPRIEKDTRRDYPEGIGSYGADALRFTLSALATQGRDIKLSLKTVEGYRNFSTKLWNAAKFAERNGCQLVPGFNPASAKHTLNRWIISETVRAAKAVRAGIQDYKFNEAAAAIYRFTWDVFCDWYIELTKPLLNGEDGPVKDETRATAAWALDQIVALLHPFMPFVTEELFAQMGQSLPGGGRGQLIAREWPKLPDSLIDPAAVAEVDWVIRLINALRSSAKELNVPLSAKAPLVVVGASKETEQRLSVYRPLVERLARLSSATTAKEPPKGAIRIVIDEATACLSVADLIDLKAELGRLEKEIARLSAEITGIDKKLSNKEFVAKAPPEVVEEQHARRTANQEAVAKLTDALKQLRDAG